MAQTITAASAEYSLKGTASPSRTNTSGPATIGSALTRNVFSTADIVYSNTITMVTASDVATLTVSSGAVAQTAGTPKLDDEGVDQEGNTITTMVTLYAVLIENCLAGEVTIAGTQGLGATAKMMEGLGDALLWLMPAGATTLGTITYDFTSGGGGGAFKTTVIGRST